MSDCHRLGRDAPRYSRGMHVALLGELEVLDAENKSVMLTGAKLRSLLTVLALHAGRVVPADQLVEALWGQDPPLAVRNGLQGLVSKLRRALGSTGLVVMRGGGYVLEVPPEAVDVHRYERLVSEGRAAAVSGDAAQAILLLREADALWRGNVLAEFAYEEFALAAITRLSELRLATVEERLASELHVGGHHGVIGELEARVALYPLRERPRGLLMTALYRAGRQADALRTYQEGRHVLGEELGLEPGPELRRLELAILAQDPALDAPAMTQQGSVTWAGRRSRIPESLTPLVGRTAELQELERRFGDCRLMTLVGPGGVGKTRLALEVARTRSSVFRNGACFVELAPLGDPAGVREAIAFALDLPDARQLAAMIGARELLLVLDNCEHVIGSAAEVAEDLLRRCPGLRVLATSREGLRVSGETIWPVPPLATNDAVQLFLSRAHAVGTRLELSDQVLGAVSDICVRLDGLPLAIELAAARTRAFPVAQILSRLNDRFRLLTGGSRNALPRQQTLRAVVDWSYELLFGDEQRVFERLSVFPGGCDLVTAQAVCCDETLPAEDLEDIIYALVDKSLVIVQPTSPAPRYTQLQTLAQYGRERLAERGESARVRDAMAAHFAALCARSSDAFSGDDQRAWLTAIDREQDNLRGALGWAVAGNDSETALTIAGGASWPHWLAGTMIEGKRWLDEAFACAGAASETTVALARTGRALIDFQVGVPDDVDADLEAALEVFRRHGDVASMALTYSFYAEVAAARGDIDEGRARRNEVLEFYMSQPDDPFVVAARAYSRGKLGLLNGDMAESERRYRKAAEGFAQIDRPMMRSMCLGMVADFDERNRDYHAAITALEEAVVIVDTLGLKGFMGALLARLGWALLQNGATERAEITYERALELARRLNNAPVVFLSLTGLAITHRLHSRTPEATQAATEALSYYRAGGSRHRAGGLRRLSNRVDALSDVLTAAAACCALLGIVAAEAGQGSEAAQLLGHADRLRTDADTAIPTFQSDEIDRARKIATSLLGQDGFAVAFDTGWEDQFDMDVVVSF